MKAFCELAQALHELVGARRHKARSDDGLCVGVSVGGLRDKALRILYGGSRRDFTQAVGRIAIHIHLADIAAYPGFLELIHKQLGSLAVQGAEDHRSCGGAAEHRVGKDTVSLIRILEVGVLRLLREGVQLQPVEQLVIHPEPPVGVLRRVDVQVGHAGHDKHTAVIENSQTLIYVGDSAENPAAYPVLAYDIAVLKGQQLVLIPAVADISLYDEAVHNNTSFPIILYSFII